jgi:diguanylate cyclase (GGDEF)-like protein/PAS domain S-box-containing protein
VVRQVAGRAHAWCVAKYVICDHLLPLQQIQNASQSPTGILMAVATSPMQGAPVADAEGQDARETARMLRTLIANIDGMVYRCHHDSQWTMEFVSDGCLAVTGYGADDLLFNSTISYEQLTHPEDRLRVRSSISAALTQGRRFDVEYRIINRSGAERWVWERGIGLYAPDGKVLAVEGIVQDISTRESTYRALRNAERRYRSLFDNAIEGIFRTSPDGRYLDANPALARIYGFDSPLDLMNSLSDIGAQLYTDASRRQTFIDTMRRHASVTGFESQIRRNDGHLIWISENARAVHDDSGRLICYEGTVEDVTELREYKERIERQARLDDLTGLANRSLLRERLQEAVSIASADNSRFALVFVDLDRFKYINDSLGHHAGDELLCVTAARLTACAPPGTTVARVGGDEFVLLVPGADEAAARSLTRTILRATGEVWHFNGTENRVNGSVGVALYPDHGRDPELLLKNADAAMYLAKDEGRSTLRFFSAELRAQITERLEVEQRLREAIQRDQLLLHFQPRVNLATGQITGAEALVRWQAPGEPLVHPGSFIAIAEETGLIVDIGRYVLRAACAQARAWLDAGHSSLVVSINASPRELQQERYADCVLEALRQFDLPPESLEIEITESMVVQDAPRLIRMLVRLREMGVNIAIDDFGTGYSNLRYLQRFPAQRLKIDRSFITDVMTNSEDAAIVKAIITLGHSLGMLVLAEGVETPPQLGLLRELGCDEVQGYLLGRPAAAAELEAQINALR